jgi:hypothetical protein
MDIADEAQAREEALIAAALSHRPKVPSSPNGVCIWCHDAPVVAGTAFCSADCAEDYEKLKWQEKQRVE